MIIKYNNVADSIQVGVPFTWNVQQSWYIKSSGGTIVRLTDGREYTNTEQHILELGNLKYATSMELK